LCRSTPRRGGNLPIAATLRRAPPAWSGPMQQNYPAHGMMYHAGYGGDPPMNQMQMGAPPGMQQQQQQPLMAPQPIHQVNPMAAHSQQAPQPGAPRSDANHPLLSDQFVILRRAPDIPEVRVRCARDEKCVKENGHRGRCSLQHRPREDDMLRLVDQIRSLQHELDFVKGERDRLQGEVSTLRTKLAKACTFLIDIVRSKRQIRSSATPTAEECHQELQKISMQCLQEEVEEKHKQFSASLQLLESSLNTITSPEEREERQQEIEAYKRQFEQDTNDARAQHAQIAHANAAELVPYMMVAQTMTATEKIVARK